MANSRLEKVGTIFTRTTALLRTGAMKSEDKPIWYDIYKAFPPKLEPRFDRPAPVTSIQPIFYEEDKIRARFHKEVKQLQSISLISTKRQTDSQMFIETYNHLKKQGALSEDKIFETSLELLQEKLQQQRQERLESVAESNQEFQNEIPSLSTRFSMAASQDSATIDNNKTNIDVKDIFKE
uniref:Small ribosomal subunit protein mS23 n=1 Tax=Culicoides sonorensis TaxID=179676 RepID=A0A336LMB5_CULSO